jgi:hypothetical protein
LVSMGQLRYCNIHGWRTFRGRRSPRRAFHRHTYHRI